MKLIVQKFGGTSVADTSSLKIVAERIIDRKKEGYELVVVPSAMGSSTDELIDLANELSEQPTPREMDICLLYTSPSPRDPSISRMPSSA